MKDYLSHLQYPLIDHDLLISKCGLLFPFLRDNNEKNNLTRIITYEDFWIKHVADSLLLLKFMPELAQNSYEIADLGCGAGFPALILALALPKSRITAIDSVGKKIDFVAGAGDLLDLKNLLAVKGRGRELSAKVEWKGKFDIITVRAVGEAKKIFREVRRMLKPQGRIILYKTPETAEKEICEVRKSAEFNWQLSPVYDLPGDKGRRCFIIGSSFSQ